MKTIFRSILEKGQNSKILNLEKISEFSDRRILNPKNLIKFNNFYSNSNFKKNSNFNNMFLTNTISKCFSEKLKLKERIRVVSVDEINDEKEDWGEIMAVNLEKEKMSNFYDNLKYLKDKNIILSLNEINRLLSLVYNRNIKAVDSIYNYVQEKNIHLDSISYHYIVSSHLQFKNFHSAFDFFFQASLFNIPQNLSVIVALYKDLCFLPNEDEKLKYQSIIENHVKKFYSEDALE